MHRFHQYCLSPSCPENDRNSTERNLDRPVVPRRRRKAGQQQSPEKLFGSLSINVDHPALRKKVPRYMQKKGHVRRSVREQQMEEVTRELMNATGTSLPGRSDLDSEFVLELGLARVL